MLFRRFFSILSNALNADNIIFLYENFQKFVVGRVFLDTFDTF